MSIENLHTSILIAPPPQFHDSPCATLIHPRGQRVSELNVSENDYQIPFSKGGNFTRWLSQSSIYDSDNQLSNLSSYFLETQPNSLRQHRQQQQPQSDQRSLSIISNNDKWLTTIIIPPPAIISNGNVSTRNEKTTSNFSAIHHSHHVREQQTEQYNHHHQQDNIHQYRKRLHMSESSLILPNEELMNSNEKSKIDYKFRMNSADVDEDDPDEVEEPYYYKHKIEIYNDCEPYHSGIFSKKTELTKMKTESLGEKTNQLSTKIVINSTPKIINNLNDDDYDYAEVVQICKSGEDSILTEKISRVEDMVTGTSTRATINNNGQYSLMPYSVLKQQQQHKSCFLLSPLTHNNHHHLHHYHQYGSINRPNSRNSLGSRLSSSHNSLSLPNANRADDSIFITQAVSHDTLSTREISDFYNVPLDSDIYAFPIDMIKPTSDDENELTKNELKTRISNNVTSTFSNIMTPKKNRSSLKYSSSSRTIINDNKRRKQRSSATEATGIEKYGSKLRAELSKNRRDISRENTLHHTPLHMTLIEVKRFYHNMYSRNVSSSEILNDSCLSTRSHYDNDKLVINEKKKNNLKKTKTAPTTPENIIESCHVSANSNSRLTMNNVKLNKISNKDNTSNNTSTSVITMLSATATTNTFNTDRIYNNNNSINNNNNKNAIQNHDKSKNTSLVITTPTNDKNNYIHCNNNNNVNNTSTNNIKLIKHNEKKLHFPKSLNLKQKFCCLFRLRKKDCVEYISPTKTASQHHEETEKLNKGALRNRALPPLPYNKAKVIQSVQSNTEKQQQELRQLKSQQQQEHQLKGPEREQTEIVVQKSSTHLASSIEKVKDCGWYWGPISSEAAERILSNEPDGSFIVRDSSDDHYIFSLSFKLNYCVRHVRIEQDQGTFSFGPYAKFKSRTITEFIEKAIEHSRSGRYLFFLHRRPEHGPMRVQLTNPVSRFKHIQSLQHMCRFVILKAVIRKDLIRTLPLPRRLLDYLCYKHCYSERVEIDHTM